MWFSAVSRSFTRQKDKNSLLAQFTQYQFRGMQREF